MKNLLLAGACACAISASGCAQLEEGIEFLNRPATQQAVATLKTVATALVCDVSSASALALSVERQIANTTGAQATTNTINVTSTLICQQLSGTVVAKVANVVAVTAVSP